MKKVHESELAANRVFGESGYVDLIDAVVGEVTAGVRVVAPNSNVPPRSHSHCEGQVIYVISGRPRITNLTETIRLRPGDFVILGAFEEHYIQTDDSESKIFEVKFPTT
ncbi:cupin domain-containing protein, partial [Candidatus Thorarchaeota archaeon]